MADYQFITYETLDDGQIARIMLNRPEARNAQNRGLLVELNDAFPAAEADDAVRVVILGGAGPMFSSGHDMGSKVSLEEFGPGPNQHFTRGINGGTREGAENRINVARNRYNDLARDFNATRRRVPTAWFVSLLGWDFPAKAYFESQPGAETAPRVEF